MSRSLSAAWSASSVAVIGASDRPGSLGRLPLEFLDRYGYPGAVYPIRPDGAEVAGRVSYGSVGDCPGKVELAMIMVGADRVPVAIDDCVAAGVEVAVVCSSGFAETGDAGAELQDEIVARARTGGLRIIGPNCIGTVGVHNRQVTSFSPLFSGASTTLVPGGLAFVSQSGALGYGAVSLAFDRGLGLGWVVTTGNEADVSALEVMAELAALPECTGVLGYLESLTDLAALQALAATGVPVAVLKAGRSAAGQRAAASHTGALAAGDRVVDAVLRRHGIVRVDDVEELLDVGDAFAQPRRAAGGRVAIVTTSGGSGILAADAVAARGLQLAELHPGTLAALDQIVPAYGATANPVDVTAAVMARPELFDQALDAIVADEGVDIVVACFCVLTGDDVLGVVGSLARAAERSGKPVLAARTGAGHLAPQAADALRAAGIPTYLTPARAVRAAAALADLSRDPRGPAPAAPPPGGPAPRPGATEQELKRLLAAAGLPVPAGRLVTDAADAVAATRAVGGRAVIKAVVPGLTHKTEAGGVAVDIAPDRAATVYRRLAALGGEVLVEELVPGGVEVLAGVATTPLGLVLTVGPGGVLTELLDDVALRLLPVDRDEVSAMLDETRLGRLLTGVRGAPPADRAALVEALLVLADTVAGWPAGFELDVNPIAVLPAGQGVRILDAAYIAPPTDQGA